MLHMLRTRLAERAVSSEPENSEQRRHRRHSVLLKASLYPINLYRDAIIHDASRTGLMGEVDIELEVGQAVHLTLDDKVYYSGIVRWTRGLRFGLDLHDELQLSGLTDKIDHGSAMGHAPRAERQPMHLPARLHTGEAPRPATVRNLSRTGMLLETETPLPPGQQLLVRIGNRPSIAARVQWSREGKIGVMTKIEVPILQMLYNDN